MLQYLLKLQNMLLLPSVKRQYLMYLHQLTKYKKIPKEDYILLSLFHFHLYLILNHQHQNLAKLQYHILYWAYKKLLPKHHQNPKLVYQIMYQVLLLQYLIHKGQIILH
ncbi:MAG: hypothetical protein EBY81_04440 [Verrucomicrobia bacterium]|nr:hypothetical protein [Verrucomicrobiota bacterium]